MTQEVDIKTVKFENGRPDFVFDKIYRCFKDKGNGLLFRLVNEKDKKWAFYNDTADSVMIIKASFNSFSQIQSLGKTRESKNAKGEIEVELEVQPKQTEVFISGTVNGFSIGFRTEGVQDAISFESGKPALSYDKIFKCFKDQGNGLLFRLVDTQNKLWAFYNDTPDYLMKVKCEFDKKSAVKVVGNAKAEGAPAGNPDGVIVTLEIQPGKTEKFVEGDPTNFRISFGAEGI